MKIKTSLLDIIQVYNYIKERPQFSNKNESGKFMELLSELHEDHATQIKYLSPSIFLGHFGKSKTINIQNAPPFEDRLKVVEWIYKQFSH